MTREEFMAHVRTLVGEGDDDDALREIEFFSEFYENAGKAEEYKSLYESNDAEWRRRYRDRFFGGNENTVEQIPPEVPSGEEANENDEPDISLDDLFKEEK